MWIFLALCYGVFIGIYSLTRKQMLKTSDIFVSAALYSLISFLTIIWEVGFIFPMNPQFIGILLGKGIIVMMAMYFAILSLKHLDVSKITLLSCLSIIITMIGGIFIFSEKMTVLQIIGSVLVLLGIVLVAIDKKFKKNNIVLIKNPKENIAILFALLSAFLNSMSSLLDKYLMHHITAFQMQFWFLLFVTILFWILLFIMCVKQKKWLVKKSDIKNIWIYLSGIILSIADLCLFWSYTYVESKVSVITVLSKLSLVVAFLGGIIFFKEDKHWLKFVYFGIVIVGIVLLSIKQPC